jgi:uncharacterized repeat protein (TIGR02543 family)
MKRITLLFLAFICVLTLQAQNWQFETAGDAEGWEGVGTATQVTIENGLLKAVHDIGADNEGPKIIQTGLSLDASSYVTAKIHLKTVDWDGAGKQFRFFWATEASPGLDGNKLITVGGITPDADNFQTIEVDLNHAQWTGTITQIRMDLCMWEGKEVHIDYIELIGAAAPDNFINVLMDFENELGTDGYTVESTQEVNSHDRVVNPDPTGVNVSDTVYMVDLPDYVDTKRSVTFVFDEDITHAKSKARIMFYAEGTAPIGGQLLFYDAAGNHIATSNDWLDNQYPAGQWNIMPNAGSVAGLTFRKVEVVFWDDWGATGVARKVYIDNLELLNDGDEYAPAEEFSLTISVNGNGSVEVDDVAFTDVITADEGTVLSLKAIADAGYVFDGWSGDLTSVNADETITMDADKTVTATFSEDAPAEVVTRWEFETDGDAEGWQPVGTTTISVQNSAMKTISDHWEGPKVSMAGLDVNADEYTHIEMALKVNAFSGDAPKNIRAFFNVPDPARLVIQSYAPDADNYVIVVLDMSAHELWTGTISQLRLDVCYGGGQDVDVDYIRLLKMPEVTVVSLAQVQIGDDIVAQSSVNGKLYLVPSATNAVIADIEAAAGTNVLDVTAGTDATFATTDLAAGDYVIYAVSEDGLLSAASKTIALTAATVVTYTVTFTVNDGSAAIEGAVVTFDGNDVTTGSDGKAIFTDVTAASYAYSVSAAGFDDASGSVTVTDADVDETVSLTTSAPTFTVTFVVDDGSEVIEGAVVTMNSSSVATDAFGMAVFNDVEAGDYAYTVTANGFSEASGSVTVSDADIQETVSLGEFTTDAVEWYFDTDGNSEGWVPNSEITTLEVQGGIMTAYSNEWTGPEIRIFGLNFSAVDYTHIEINMKTRVFAENEAKQVRVFWNDPAAERLVLKDFTANADDFQVLEIDMSGHEFWTGQITDMRFDVCYGHGKEIDIDYIKMTNPGGSNAVSEKMVNFGVYPNPASGAVYVFGNWNAPVDYRIISITGETVSQGSISAEDRQINLEGVSSGIYFITIKNQASKLIVK